ncbi:myosin-binding striated muscle assembly central-domain-containing protein [Phyllosticta citriasiana]|uniref:myosin-binding striated muscle assembly central-domain-containing protein n=1 Tax=Phyllosticta citriasiana TaxID=595635 RepID=UPI0030FD9008
MAEDHDQSRITQLVSQADADIEAANYLHAADLLREASAIHPENALIRDTWQRLHAQESRGPFVSLVRSYLNSKNEKHGWDAVAYAEHNQLSRDVAEEATQILMDFTGEDAIADRITGRLLKGHLHARKYLAAHFKEKPHNIFERFFDRGDDSTEGLFVVLLDSSAWTSEDERITALRDIFMLSLAQMMEAGLAHPERAMKSISRALVAEANHLNGIIDADGFDVILSSMDIRAPPALRSQATLATAKLLELSPENSQKLISRYVAHKVQYPTTDGLVLAFSAAAAIFPIAPQQSAALFLTQGFLEGLPELVMSRRSQRLEQAALELLSAACIEKTCREAIAKHVKFWLEDVAKTSLDKAKANKAALILVKIHEAPAGEDSAMVSDSDDHSQDELVARFKKVVLSSDEVVKQESVEGLAYSSLKPRIKEELAKDKVFLRELVKVMNAEGAAKPLIFGGLTILSNLTAYRPVSTEEQKRISQLKAYANSKKPAPDDPLDDDAHVTARCAKVLQANVVPFLVHECKKASPNVLSQILGILLSLSKEQKHRGTMAQQGVIKALVQVNETVQQHTSHTQASYGKSASRTAAHILARILISVNPHHIFSNSTLPITTAVRPLVHLLDDDPEQEQRDLLPVFESLLALTNLASAEDDAREAIIKLAWTRIEDLLLANNPMVQRAAVELVCNLQLSPHGAIKFADGTPAARNRLHILLALADAEDAATRRAAGGALAMLTEWDAAADAVLQRERGVDIVMGLVEDDADDLRHRGVVCLKNLVTAPGPVGGRGREKVKALNGPAVLKEVLKETKNPAILQEGVVALKALL